MKVIVESAANAAALLKKLEAGQYEFVSMHLNCEDDLSGLARAKTITNLHGATSCNGAMTHEGATTGASAFALHDPEGAYGTAMVEAGDDMREAAKQATKQALVRADRVGELPDLVWVAATPGDEEAVLAGIEDVVGADVPILGGSAADNSVSGDWFVFDGTSQSGAGVVVSVLFPSEPVSFAYQNGYAPTAHTGTVTKTDGRKVLEINDRPATEVYAEWTAGAVTGPEQDEDPRAILSDSTMWPLGRQVGALGDVPFYLLAHPAMAHSDGSMDLFATVSVGEELTSMHGTKQSLIERAGRVGTMALQNRDAGPTPPAGALMIYCGGCMLSVQDRIDDVVSGVNAALDGVPFLGAFTFGEQGPLIRGGNRHGNLMISCIVFG